MVKYYYIDDISKQQCGPFPSNDLPSKRIRPETLVWRSGMPDWINAGSVPELSFLFNTKIPLPEERKPEAAAIKTSPAETVAAEPKPQSQPLASPQPANNYQQTNYKQDNNTRRWDDILPMPKNWLVESILLSIFCCSPISVVGIFYAAKVESLYYAKEYDRATQAAENAKKWALAGILFLPACYVLLVIFGAIVGSVFSWL